MTLWDLRFGFQGVKMTLWDLGLDGGRRGGIIGGRYHPVGDVHSPLTGQLDEMYVVELVSRPGDLELRGADDSELPECAQMALERAQ